MAIIVHHGNPRFIGSSRNPSGLLDLEVGGGDILKQDVVLNSEELAQPFFETLLELVFMVQDLWSSRLCEHSPTAMASANSWYQGGANRRSGTFCKPG